MRNLLDIYKDQIINYCISQNISFDKLLKQPRCKGNDFVFIQHSEPSKGLAGLSDFKPAKVLLAIVEVGNEIEIQSAPDIKKYLI